MARERDPIEKGATDSADLYDVATWESRSWLDRIAGVVHGGGRRLGRAIVVLLALTILAAQFALTGLAAITDPYVGAFVLLSVVPAFGLAAYIWYADVTTSEPLSLLVATFLLGVLFAGFAAILNTAASIGLGYLSLPSVAGMVVFFYLVVAPVEETVKWLTIRLYAFRSDRFDAVIDGAVYGAMAGLGFATIENAIYITQSIGEVDAIGTQQIAAAGQTAAVRLLAGPGHVIYSAFAGYYLGLAKFNREDAGPIVVKGLLIAGFIHATYNSLVTYLGPILEFAGIALAPGVAFIGFVVVYDTFFGYFLYRKLSRYRKAYKQVNMGQSVTFEDDGETDDSAVSGDGTDEGESAEGTSESGSAEGTSESGSADGTGDGESAETVADARSAENEGSDTERTEDERADGDGPDGERVGGQSPENDAE